MMQYINAFLTFKKKHCTETKDSMTGVLLCCLASLTFHLSAILNKIKDYPYHPLLQIPILDEPTLLANLVPLIIIEPSCKIQTPTGIPPYVKLLSKLQELLGLFQEEQVQQCAMQETLVATVKAAIEENALANGNITHHSMCTILDDHQKRMDESMEKQSKLIDEKMSAFMQSRGHVPAVTTNASSAVQTQSDIGLYNWDGRFWQVPKGFLFPIDCKRKRAWGLWLIGQPSYMALDGTIAPILPYHLMSPKLLPKKVANKLKVEWRPVLAHMQSAVDLSNLKQEDILSEYLNFYTHYCHRIFKIKCVFMCMGEIQKEQKLEN